jgi:hypothetical protein
VPARIASRLVAVPVTCLALVAALLPLSVAASQPTQTSGLPAVISWLQANGLHYGLGGYWDSSETSLESADQVQIRSVDGGHTAHGNVISFYPWETVIGVFGKPVRTQIIENHWEIFVYHENLLTRLSPPTLKPMS